MGQSNIFEWRTLQRAIRSSEESDPNVFAGKAFWTVVIAGLYVALVPSTTPLSSLEMYNEKRVLQLALMGAVGTFLLVSIHARRQWLSTFLSLPLLARIALGIVAFLGLLSAIRAPAPGDAFLEIGHLTLLFVLATSVAAATRRTSGFIEALVLGSVVFSALLYAVHFFVSYGLSVAWPALEIGRETISGFANVRFFNQYQTWTLPLLGIAVWTIPARWRVGRSLVFFLLALWWTLVLASEVRGTVVAMGIAITGVGLVFRGRSLRWLATQGAALVVGSVLYYLLFDLPGGSAPQVANRLAETSSESWRMQRWMTCLELTRSSPWLGVGPMHFAWLPFRIEPGSHPHSAFFQWLVEWGLPSTAIMSTLTVWGVWRWIQQEQRASHHSTERQNAVRVGLVVSVLAGAAHAMVSGLLVMPVSQVLLALTFGWAWGRYRPKTASVDLSWISHATLCALLVGSMTAVGQSLQDLSNAEARRSSYFEKTKEDQFWPRYWHQGFIGTRQFEGSEQSQKKRSP